MKNFIKTLILIFFITQLLFQSAFAEDNPLDSLHWQVGPTEGSIGNKAKIRVPKGFVFLGEADTKKFMEISENIPRDNHYLIAPNDLSWFAFFHFSPVGYVKDDETLDADALLDTVTKGTEQGNIERRKRGWGTMTILGWKFRPRYDQQSKLLEWAFAAKDDGTNTPVVNYNTRLLGRKGVMEVVLVASPSILDPTVATFKRVINGYSFDSGERYADYREGDHVAEFGLAALITGGAAAIATKKGFWAAIVGFIVAAKKLAIAVVIGLIAWFKSLFKRKQ